MNCWICGPACDGNTGEKGPQHKNAEQKLKLKRTAKHKLEKAMRWYAKSIVMQTAIAVVSFNEANKKAKRAVEEAANAGVDRKDIWPL